jgi:hypothetical protein
VQKGTTTFSEFLTELHNRSGSSEGLDQISSTPNGNTDTCSDDSKGGEQGGNGISNVIDGGDVGQTQYVYLQNMLYDGLGEQIVSDFQKWNWQWVLTKEKQLGRYTIF